MLDEDLKEYIGKELKLNAYEIKEHINFVNGKVRKDFNLEIDNIKTDIKTINAETKDNTKEIEFSKRLVKIAYIVLTAIGLERLARLFY